MIPHLCALLLCLPVLSGTVKGRVMGGGRGIPGVRVYPDRTVAVRPRTKTPLAITDGQGRFSLELCPEDTVLVMERSGLQRDLVPVGELDRPVRLHRAPGYRRDPVLVVRLDDPGRPAGPSDPELRALLFGRHPGEASAANYFYEISKGSLELEEGRWLHLAVPEPSEYWLEDPRIGLVDSVLEQLKGRDLSRFDRVDDRDGARRPDGKPDHLWVIAPGPAFGVTSNPDDLNPACRMAPLPWNLRVRWPVVFFTDQTPLGFIVHEALHAQGEQRVMDFFLDDTPLTAGAWDVMDAGQFRGWDSYHPGAPPWQEDTAYSPSTPMGFTRADLWYHGAFRATVPTRKVSRTWEGWLDPLARAAGAHPQRLVVPDPNQPGRFWDLEVRRPLGFDRGRVGQRWGPGCQGLVVARVNPAAHRAPVRVLPAHPDPPEPPPPRYPGGRWRLDEAAFNLGPGEVGAGQDGPLRWEILEVDGSGRMRVRVKLLH